MSGQCPMGFSRRGILGGALAAAAAAPAALAFQDAEADAPTPAAEPTSYPFFGEHQQGIVTPAQRQGAFLAMDLTVADAAGLQDMLRVLTDTLRRLTEGRQAPDTGLVATEVENGVLGPDVPADRFTGTIGLGASVFDDRYGLAAAKPARLRPMDTFPNDALKPEWCHGDVLLELCADHQDTLIHAMREITRATRGAMQPRWRIDGFTSPARPSGTPRNLLGFKDGTANPATSDAALMDELIWTRGGGDEPSWTTGGSYHVVRLIRMFVEFWDRISVREQQALIGRDRVTGAPLTGMHEFDEPDYAGDAQGELIPFGAHIRLANPRVPATERDRILRRGFNYDMGTDPNGQLNQGLVFNAFNQDLDRQFVTIQKRLVDEPLVDYISPFGGGYFFALPGVRDEHDWLGRGMFS